MSFKPYPGMEKYPGFEDYPIEWLIEMGGLCPDCGGWGQIQYAAYTAGGDIYPEVEACETCDTYGYFPPVL